MVFSTNTTITISDDDLILIFDVLTPLSVISWRPVLVVREAGLPRENHRPWASNW
jgi:hypothetical protein